MTTIAVKCVIRDLAENNPLTGTPYSIRTMLLTMPLSERVRLPC